MNQEINRRQFLYGAAAATATGLASSSPALAFSRGRPGRDRSKADLVIHNGKILTMDRRNTVAEAVAIADGKIQDVGRAKDIFKLVGRHTELIDAGRGTVIPGINDSHFHFNGFGLNFPPFSIDVDVATIEELVAEVQAAAAAALTPDSWIRGRGWNDNRLPRVPTRHDLDPVSGDHPVRLTDFSAHATLINTKLMVMSGITRDTIPPVGGVIEKDANGEPTGVLREGAQGLALSAPPFTQAERDAADIVAMDIMNGQGITSITVPGTSMNTVQSYATRLQEGTLRMRIVALLSAGRSVESTQNAINNYVPLGADVDPRMVSVAGVKIFADGIPTEARSAWMREPYSDGTNGTLVLSGASHEEQLANLYGMIALADDFGFQVGTHATGDATIDATVDACVQAMRQERKGRRKRDFHDPRHYTIHSDYTHPETLRRMAHHRIGANFNATIKYVLGRTVEDLLGDRIEKEWPYRTALKTGVNVASSSDAPVTFPSALRGLMAAATGAGAFGGVRGLDETISVRQGLRTYTTMGAWQDFAERWKGALERGMVADVAVLDGDLLRTDPHDLPELQFSSTILNGEVVYERESSLRAERTSKRFRAAASKSGSHDAFGRTCLQGGKCCCALEEDILNGKSTAEIVA